LNLFFIEQEKKEEEKEVEEKKGHKKATYSSETKFQVVEAFARKQQAQKNLPHQKYDTQLTREAIAEMDEKTVFETARNWTKAYNKDNGYLLLLEQEAKKEKNRRMFHPEKRRFKYPLELELEIVAWIYFNRQNEIPITGKDVLKFSRDLITSHCPSFRGSYHWFQRFRIRNNISLRVPNTKASQKLPKGWGSLANDFREELREVIEREGISSNSIINMDEMPLFYEYLPKKSR